MDQFAGPATLGSVTACLMLAAWMLGRWQGGVAGIGNPLAADGVEDMRPPAPPVRHGSDTEANRPCQDAARDERRAVAATASALGELHADTSAYRRAQQVLQQIDFSCQPIGWSASGESEACRYLGVSGQPTCPVNSVASARGTCGACVLDIGSLQARTAQPSAAADTLARV